MATGWGWSAIDVEAVMARQLGIVVLGAEESLCAVVRLWKHNGATGARFEIRGNHASGGAIMRTTGLHHLLVLEFEILHLIV